MRCSVEKSISSFFHIAQANIYKLQLSFKNENMKKSVLRIHIQKYIEKNKLDYVSKDPFLTF